MQTILIVLIPILYAASAIFYAANFRDRRDRLGRTATSLLAGGWVFHAGLLGARAASTGHVPLMNTPEVLSTCAWVLVIVYAYLEFSTKDRALGALVAPIVTVLQTIASTGLAQAEIPVHLLARSRWFEMHVILNILAYTAFSVSWVSSIMYVFLLGEIQGKHLGFFYKRLPPLQTLDQVNSRSASFGFVFLTLGLAASSIWVHRVRGQFWVWNEPAFAGALAVWLIYAGHLWARTAGGWRGKRAAFLSIVGFTLVLFTFPIVGILFAGRHSFAN